MKRVVEVAVRERGIAPRARQAVGRGWCLRPIPHTVTKYTRLCICSNPPMNTQAREALGGLAQAMSWALNGFPVLLHMLVSNHNTQS
jgi:hypothetical protein